MTRTRSGVSIGGSAHASAGSELFIRKPPAIETGKSVIRVLSVSPTDTDHDFLERLLHPPQWCIRRAKTLESATAILKEDRPPLVVCERDLGRETWRDVLAHIVLMRDPPFLIVTSRLADEYLWSEALNLGAYDVLAKPLDAAEVTRTLTLAWLHWRDHHQPAKEPMQIAVASA